MTMENASPVSAEGFEAASKKVYRPKKAVVVSTAKSEAEIKDPRELTRDELYEYAFNHGGIVQRATFKPKDAGLEWQQEGWKMLWLIDHDAPIGYQLVMFGETSAAKNIARKGKLKIFVHEGISEEQFDQIYRVRGVHDKFSMTVIKTLAAIINHPKYPVLYQALNSYISTVIRDREDLGVWKKTYIKFFEGVRLNDKRLGSVAKVITSLPDPNKEKVNAAIGEILSTQFKTKQNQKKKNKATSTQQVEDSVA